MEKIPFDLEYVENAVLLGKASEVSREIEKQDKVGRWEKYRKAGNTRSQSVSQHVTSAIASTLLVLKPLLWQRQLEFDGELLSDAVAVHDIGEIYHLDEDSENDVLYENKSNDKDLKEYHKFLSIYDRFIEDEKIEREKERVGPQFGYIHEVYLLQYARSNPSNFPDEARKIMEKLWKEKPVTVLLFELVERLGYVQYAYEQYKHHNNVCIFVQVVNSQGPHLDKLFRWLSTLDGFWQSLRKSLYAFTELRGAEFPNPGMYGKEVWFPAQTPPPEK
ncbi:MAG: hypothetical protein WD335_04070 [Candidatus Paceibacterota bacterium]